MAKKTYVAESFGLMRFLRRIPERFMIWRKHYGTGLFLIPLGFIIEIPTILLMGHLNPPRFFGLSVLAAMCLSLGLHFKRSRRNYLWEFHY